MRLVPDDAYISRHHCGPCICDLFLSLFVPTAILGLEPSKENHNA